jgi:chaperone modulatory protein CbpM
MSMEHDEFLIRARLDDNVLEGWVAAGWLTPNAEEGMQQFSEIDVARVRLIQDLRRDIGVNDAGVGVILDLIDQLHGLRRTLGHLLTALQAQPHELRERLAVDLHQVMGAAWPNPGPAADKPSDPAKGHSGTGRQF